MSPIFDKARYSAGKLQYALQVKPGDVGKYVLLPGDPDRVARIGRRLDSVREIAFNREFRTCTGIYKGIPVSATSTGVGCPSASIAVEELANVGATHFIRVGSTAALQPYIQVGDIIINTAAMRNEGTTRFYVRDGFPAAADHMLTHTLIEAALALKASRGFSLHVGLNACDDAFYGETPEHIDMLQKHRLLNVEMESAAIFTVAHLRGLKAAMITGVSANLVTSDVVYEGEKVNQRLVHAWDNEIEIALEAIDRYEHSQHEF
jgi:uridine phosphorylase